MRNFVLMKAKPDKFSTQSENFGLPEHTANLHHAVRWFARQFWESPKLFVMHNAGNN